MEMPFDYIMLFGQFINGRISVDDFQAIYLDRFKNEEMLDEPMFELLGELFGDVDAFTDDPQLLTKNQRFYIDEKILREKVLRIWSCLASLKR